MLAIVILIIILLPLWATTGWVFHAVNTWPKRIGVITKRELSASPAEGTEWRVTVQYYFDYTLYKEKPTFGHFITFGFNSGDNVRIVVKPKKHSQIILDCYSPMTYIISSTIFSLVVLFLFAVPYLAYLQPR